MFAGLSQWSWCSTQAVSFLGLGITRWDWASHGVQALENIHDLPQTPTISDLKKGLFRPPRTDWPRPALTGHRRKKPWGDGMSVK